MKSFVDCTLGAAGHSSAVFMMESLDFYGVWEYWWPLLVYKIRPYPTASKRYSINQHNHCCSFQYNGYVGDNAAIAENLTSDGWLKTGDLCYFDSDGFLYIVDRLKELIKYKAYQVAPAELEHIIHSIPGVADVAVIPYPDEDAGQIPMAYVVRSPGSNISEREIQDFVAKQELSAKIKQDLEADLEAKVNVKVKENMS